ncbi:MAG: DUF6484 domain-containing protein [Proteobacteria bacterium]|nr:DUF6484 domain-containing protein [Pseudomonadota bacterium]
MTARDPFQPLPGPATSGHALLHGPATLAPPAPAATAVLARLHGFDLLEQPLVTGLAPHPHQVLAARSTVALRREQVGREVLLVWAGDVAVITGVLEPHPLHPAPGRPPVRVQADEARHVIEADREIVLRCGDASITLTRAGKVLIKGSYILSRASGYNKIKGAAIDIN